MKVEDHPFNNRKVKIKRTRVVRDELSYLNHEIIDSEVELEIREHFKCRTVEFEAPGAMTLCVYIHDRIRVVVNGHGRIKNIFRG